MQKSGFASDNYAGVHPEVFQALERANQDYAPAYGADAFTAALRPCFESAFGTGTVAYPVFNGTAANVLGLAAVITSYQAVICSEIAHIQNDECGAPERWTGAKLLPVPHHHGKLTADGVKARLADVGDPHHSQPRVLSISQTTELGTVYRPEEIRALAELVHSHGLLLHMDGARVANAAAALGLSLRAITRDVGVDVLSFGATKNGALAAEAVVFFDEATAPHFRFLRKQGMQLASKLRFFSAQLEALFHDDLWLRNAGHANAMAGLLAREIADISQVRVSRPVEANAVFAELSGDLRGRLAKEYLFHDWNVETGEVRWMTSFRTMEGEVLEFASAIRRHAS